MLEILLVFWAFLFKKKPREIKKIPSGFYIDFDAGYYDLDNVSVDLYHPEGKNRFVTGEELVKQVNGKKLLGQKSLDDYMEWPDMIPDSFKFKTILFMGTRYKDKENKTFVPCFYYHALRGLWVESFVCLSEAISIKHNCVPVVV